MRGIWFESGRARFRDDLPAPEPAAGEARVRVQRAGVCATDLALLRGYMGFAGVPGHEFVGRALDGRYAGQRVVGELNAACGACERCRRGLGRHCAQRTVLGILGRGGAFADELVLPEENLHPVPSGLSDDAATFAEPLAAAFEIPEQVRLEPGGRALVVGDGRLGLLCAQVLARAGLEVSLAGRHPDRVEGLPRPMEHRGDLLAADGGERWELVVEATGDPGVLAGALGRVEPRGTLVLKTTTERPVSLDLAPLVVDEITLVGSRCGPFPAALGALAAGEVAVEQMVQARYPLEEGPRALEHAAERGVLKVIVEVERA